MVHGQNIRDISDGEAVFLIVIGFVAVIIGLANKQFYGGNRFRQGPPIARWKGMTLFLLVGSVFIAAGIYHMILVW